jgi:putative polyketide hydroxylase
VLDGFSENSTQTDASDSIDTSEAERRSVAEHNLARSLDPIGSRRSPGEELRFDRGGRLQVWLVGNGGEA